MTRRKRIITEPLSVRQITPHLGEKGPNGLLLAKSGTCKVLPLAIGSIQMIKQNIQR
jgi:hypothetical protein